MYTLKTNANPFATPSKRRKHKLAKTELKQMGNTDCEVLIDSMKIQLRELEHDYIKEFEKKMHAEEGGKDLDESTLKKIGREIDKLEAALENVGKEEDNIIEKEKTPIPTMAIIKLVVIIYVVAHILRRKFLYL